MDDLTIPDVDLKVYGHSLGGLVMATGLFAVGIGPLRVLGILSAERCASVITYGGLFCGITAVHLFDNKSSHPKTSKEVASFRLWRVVVRPALTVAATYTILRWVGMERPLLRTAQLNGVGVIAVWVAHLQSGVDAYLAVIEHRRKFFDDHDGMVKLFKEGNWPKAVRGVDKEIGTAKQRKRVVTALLAAQEPGTAVQILKGYKIDEKTVREAFDQLIGGDADLLGKNGDRDFLRFAYLGERADFGPCGDDPVKFLSTVQSRVGNLGLGSLWRLLPKIKGLFSNHIKDVSPHIFGDFYGEEKHDLKVFQRYLRMCNTGKEQFCLELTDRQKALAWAHWLNYLPPAEAVEKALIGLRGLSDDQVEFLDKFWMHDRELLRAPLCVIGWDKDHDSWFKANLKDEPVRVLLDVYLKLSEYNEWSAGKKERLREHLCKADWSVAVADGFDSQALLELLKYDILNTVIDVFSIVPPSVTGERSVGRAYRLLQRVRDLPIGAIEDVSSPIFNDFYKDEVRDPAVFRKFLKSRMDRTEKLSGRQMTHVSVQRSNDLPRELAREKLYLHEVLDNEEIEVFWKFWRHPPGILLKWLLERGLDDDRYSQQYEKLMEGANSYTQVSAYCCIPELHGKQPALLEKLKLNVMPFKVRDRSQLQLAARYFGPNELYGLRLLEKKLGNWGDLLPQILLAPDGKGRRELTFELLHPSVWDRSAPGWREVDWRDMEQFKKDDWPLIALEKQCIAKGSQLVQLGWMMRQDWKGVPCASKAFETVLALCPYDASIISPIRNAWSDKMQGCDNLNRVRAVLGKDREIVPALVDEFLVHKSSLEQLVWMVMNLPLAKDNWAVVGEGIARYAKRREFTHISPKGTIGAIRSLVPQGGLKEIDDKGEREQEMGGRILALAFQHDLYRGFGSVCHYLIPHLDRYRGFQIARRAFSKEQLEVFFRLPAVRERVIAGLEKWKIADRLNLVRLLLSVCSNDTLKPFVTDKVVKVMLALARRKEEKRDRGKIHAFLFRSCSPDQLRGLQSQAARRVVEGKYNWKRKSCYTAWSEADDVMPLAVMLFQCKHHGGAKELLSWLKRQKWKGEGRAPHAIERLQKIVKENGD